MLINLEQEKRDRTLRKVLKKIAASPEFTADEFCEIMKEVGLSSHVRKKKEIPWFVLDDFPDKAQ